MLAHALDVLNPAIRFVAWCSLKKLLGFADFSYDSVGSAEHRRDAVERVATHWSVLPPPVKPRPEILLDPAALKRLQQLRHNRSIDIPE